jgi:hypothetical protein
MLAGGLGSRLSPMRPGLTVGLRHEEFALSLPTKVMAVLSL